MRETMNFKRPMLYALRGVSRECPENTLAAIRTAICQGYDGVILDVQVTADGIPVLGRKPHVTGLTGKQVSRIAVGEAFSRRFRNETIPTLAQALALTEAAGMQVCLIMDQVGPEQEEAVFSVGESCAFCYRDARRVVEAARTVSAAGLAYWGEFHEDTYSLLCGLGNRLTVWTDSPETVWHGEWKRGITGVDSYAWLETVCARYTPDFVCSDGIVKPEIRRGFQADTHVHSEYSHDSVCPVAEIGEAAKEKGMDLICITDHCDIVPNHDETSLLEFEKQTITGIRSAAEACRGPQILAGIELGGGFLGPEIADRVVMAEAYDAVIGSVHGIVFHGRKKSTSKCDFSELTADETLEYLNGYLDSSLYIAEKLDVDILAHLTYIFRYTNGKYGLGLDWRIREQKIKQILRAIIDRGIALEINTSSVGSAYDEWLPCRQIVDLYLDMGGYLFTLGSDAHASKRIGHCFDEVTAYLRSRGIRYAIYFKNRIAHQYSICEACDDCLVQSSTVAEGLL